MKPLSLLLACTVVAGSASLAQAACVNKFISRTEGPRQVVSLLTGKITFQEAQVLSEAIATRKAPPVEWVDEKGKPIAKQFGELKVVRPMPVGCDGRTSGVVMIVTFPTGQKPAAKMHIKLDGTNIIAFDHQQE